MLIACLMAYPRELRARVGPELVDLADDLADHHGTWREALGLIRGGLREHWRRSGRRRRTAVALTLGSASALTVLSWSAVAAGPGQVEADRFDCAGDCATVRTEVDRRIAAGWTCAEERGATAVTWRCTLDR